LTQQIADIGSCCVQYYSIVETIEADNPINADFSVIGGVLVTRFFWNKYRLQFPYVGLHHEHKHAMSNNLRHRDTNESLPKVDQQL
jgi:hypothetical protein